MAESAKRDEEYLHALVSDYEAARSDDRAWSQLVGTLFGILVALLGVLAATLPSVQGFGCKAGGSGCHPANSFLLAVIPVAPVAVLGYAAYVGIPAALRSYYMRELEEEIRKVLDRQPMQALYGERVSAFSWVDLQLEVASLRRGRLGYRALALTIFVCVAVAYGGLIVVIFQHVGTTARALMAVFYSAVALFLLAMAHRGTSGGLAVFKAAASKLAMTSRGRPAGEGGATTAERSSASHGGLALARYLLLPRPVDVVKWLFVPGATLVFLSLSRNTYHWHWHLLAVLSIASLVFEGLVYAARYQWNDVRDYRRDDAHPAVHARGRLPRPAEPAAQRSVLITSIIVLVYRLGLAVALTAILAPPLVTWSLASIGLVFGSGLVYELLKDASRKHAIDEGGDVWPALLAIRRVAPVWLWVGTGYAVRGVAAWQICLYAGGRPSAAVVTLAILLLAAYGMLFVTQTWALEATSFLLARIADDPRRPHWITAAGRQKPHAVSLLRFLCLGVPVFTSTGGSAERDAQSFVCAGSGPALPLPRAEARTSRLQARFCSFARERALVRPTRPLSPWHPALIVCAGCAEALIFVSPGGTIDAALAAGLTVAVCFAVLSSLLLRSKRWRWLVALGAVAAAFVLTAGSGHSTVAAVPFAIVVIVDAVFRVSSFHDLVMFSPNVAALLSKVLRRALVFAFADAAELLLRQQRGREDVAEEG